MRGRFGWSTGDGGGGGAEGGYNRYFATELGMRLEQLDLKEQKVR